MEKYSQRSEEEINIYSLWQIGYFLYRWGRIIQKEEIYSGMGL